MTADSLVHHVDHLQVGIVLLGFIHPLLDGLVLLFCGEVVHPTGILRSPYEGVELERKTMFLRILVCFVGTSPIVGAVPVSFHTLPFCSVLRRHLVPVVGKDETVGVHVAVPSCCDVTQELVGVC